MNTENHEVVETVTEVQKPRTRRVKPKVQKTGAEIVADIELLQGELKDLEVAFDEVAPNSAARPIVQAALDAKNDELAKLLETVYTA